MQQGSEVVAVRCAKLSLFSYMKSDIIIIGGGAAGLMAAYGAASVLRKAGSDASVTVLEKMPRPGRKIMITGKGRCNFTNVKDWNAFSTHIRTNPNFVKPAFYNLTPEKLIEFFDSVGMESVVERGDRAFPASHHASDVVDALVRACHGLGVKIETETTVDSIAFRNVCEGDASETRATIGIVRDGATQQSGVVTCRKLIIATGGLSYPTTGSTGDGYRFASTVGHRTTPLFPSLTALVPRGYKIARSTQSTETQIDTESRVSKISHPILSNPLTISNLHGTPQQQPEGSTPQQQPEGNTPYHIDRNTPLSETGEKLKGIQLKNVSVQLLIEGTVAQEEFGDIDFTDGGIEGPVGFQLSRKAVKALINGSRVKLVLDLKPGVGLTELTTRVKELWAEIDKDPRSRGVREKERCRILLGKLMPWDLIPGFTAMHPEIITLERRSRTETKVWVNLVSIAKALKAWTFDIEGHVGYERAVVTAGGIDTSEVIAKTLESRLIPGLYLCGEVLDIDSDTGGYNLHTAFATGLLAGQSAAKNLLSATQAPRP